jgi:hypothetical protein
MPWPPCFTRIWTLATASPAAGRDRKINLTW